MHGEANLSRDAVRRTLMNIFRALIRPTRRALCAIAVVGAPLVAQPAAELISAGDRESAARHPAQALPFFEHAIQQEPSNATALWKASRELVDLGEFETNVETRTAYYARATDYAKRAVTLAPNDAETHFHLARAFGRTALALGPRERVKYGIDVRAQALRALELAPRHPGALHVMGVWNAEIMRLNGISRLVAKTFLGGKVFETASWSEAVRYMELSVAAEPARLVHRLDLARVYRDVGRKADARASYLAAIAAAAFDANDELYRREAEKELAAMR
jgi:regulator of microtubule dynamics protein 3